MGKDRGLPEGFARSGLKAPEVHAELIRRGFEASAASVYNWCGGAQTPRDPDLYNAVATVINEHLDPQDWVPMYELRVPTRAQMSKLRVIQGGKRREDRAVKDPRTSVYVDTPIDLPLCVSLAV